MSETHGVFDTATGAGGGATASPIATTGGGGGGSIATGTAGSPNAAVISVQGITNGTAVPVSITSGGGTTPTGTAGSPNASVISVQGIAGGTAQPVSGTVSISGTVPVSGTFWQTTQPVSLAALPALATGSNAIGSVSVSNFPGTQPVSGTVGISGTVPVSGTFYQATQPISAAALPLPSGAATAAKQPALGTAGSASTDVITVQGIANGVSQPVTPYIAASIATNQVSVGATATLIVASRTGRRSVTVIQEGTTLVRLGASGVTAATGIPLPGTTYSAFTIDGGAAVYGIVASGTQTVSYIEAY